MPIYTDKSIEILSDSEGDNIPPKNNKLPENIDTNIDLDYINEILKSDDDDDSSSPLSLKDSYSSLKMIVDGPESSSNDESSDTNDIKKKKKKKKNKEDSSKEEHSELDIYRSKKENEKLKKEKIVQKIFEEVESRHASENETKESEENSEESKKSEEEQKISDYIRQKRKRKKFLEENRQRSNNSDSITDFFDRGSKRKKTESNKLASNSFLHEGSSNPINKELEEDTINIPEFKIDKKIINSDSSNDRSFSSESEKENEDEDEETRQERESKKKEFENIKNKINDIVPNLIDEINKNLDTQKALLNDSDLSSTLDNSKDQPDKESKGKNKNTGNRNKNKKNIDSNPYRRQITIEEDEDDKVEMSSLVGIKKIHLTFNGYKLMPNNEFVRIYPLTLEIPETAKFKTIFKAYCAGTGLKEDEILFNYNNIEIFSTSTLKGLDMTSTLENYRIDVFYRIEYQTYKYQLKVQQIYDEEKQKEKEKQEMNILSFKDTNFDDDDDDIGSDRNISIIIQDSKKNETKLFVNKNCSVEELGKAYIKKLSLNPSILSKLNFYFDGQKLEKDETMKELDVENQDIFDLKIDD